MWYLGLYSKGFIWSTPGGIGERIYAYLSKVLTPLGHVHQRSSGAKHDSQKT